jgi:Fe-Mn family superoxide dismutase
MERSLPDNPTEFGRRTVLGLFAGATLLARAAGADSRGGSGVTTTTPSAKSHEYTLPPLPYAKDALDGFLSSEILEIHHDKHHAGYVKGLNKALADLDAARQAGQFTAIKELERDLAFNGSGHVLHSLYWVSMSPTGGGIPKGPVGKLLEVNFGSFDGFRKQFAAAAKAAEASSWALLSYEPLGDRLIISAAESHENMAFQGAIPLIACDVWEHAYYLRYRNDRASYVEKFFDVINWDGADERLARVQRTIATGG